MCFGPFPILEGTAVQVRRLFQDGEIPSSHHREEGWPSDQVNIAQHPLSRGRGGVPIDGTRNTTPAASIRRLRAIFLVTQPPLLCRASVKAESHGLWVSKITAASKRIDTNVSSVAILLPRRSPYCSPDPPLLIGSEGRIRGAQISNRAELRKFPFDDKQPAIR